MSHDELLQITRQLSPVDVCAELLALGSVEYSYTPKLSITLELGESEGTLADTGRGMRFTPDTGDTIAHAERALTGFYPCLPSGPEFAASLRELIWRDHGSLGPSVVNVACALLQFTSKRDGEVRSQSYAYGVRPWRRPG